MHAGGGGGRGSGGEGNGGGGFSVWFAVVTLLRTLLSMHRGSCTEERGQEDGRPVCMYPMLEAVALSSYDKGAVYDVRIFPVSKPAVLNLLAHRAGCSCSFDGSFFRSLRTTHTVAITYSMYRSIPSDGLSKNIPATAEHTTRTVSPSTAKVKNFRAYPLGNTSSCECR